MAVDDLLIERLLRVIDEGRRTATYKLALLLALIDAVAESPGAEEIPTRLIAERVVDLYFPQTRTFVDGAGVAHAPRQISMKSSPVLAAVTRLRTEADAQHCRSAAQAALAMPKEFQATVDAVEETFVRYPIPLMQVVGSGVVPFLYEVDWAEGASVKALRSEGRDQLRLLPGVGGRLVVLGPMLRPLIELH